jgi:hypothetical protein
MGTVATTLTTLQTALAVPGGTTVATDAYTASIAAAAAAESAIDASIASNESAFGQVPTSEWTISGSRAVLTGTPIAGETYSLTADGTTYSYTAVAGDTLATIASAIADEAGGDAPIWAVSGSTATLTSAVLAGETFVLTVNGEAFAYTATSIDTVTTVLNQLAVAIIVGLGIQTTLSGSSLTATGATILGNTSIFIPGVTWVAGTIAFTPFAGAPVTLGGVLSAPLAAAALTAAVVTLGNLAALTAAQGYVERIAVNLANAST